MPHMGVFILCISQARSSFFAGKAVVYYVGYIRYKHMRGKGGAWRIDGDLYGY